MIRTDDWLVGLSISSLANPATLEADINWLAAGVAAGQIGVVWCGDLADRSVVVIPGVLECNPSVSIAGDEFTIAVTDDLI